MIEHLSSNATLNRTSMAPPIDRKLIGTVFFSLICCLGTFGNSLVIVTVARWREMRTPCNVLIANISFVDLVVSLIMAPMRIIEGFSLGWIFGKVLCYAVAPFQDGVVAVSAVCHTVIAIERYRAILSPFKPRLNKRKTKMVVVLIWVGCYVGASLPLVFFVKYERKEDIMICRAGLFPEEDYYIYSLYLVSVFIVLPLLLQSISYVLIIRFLQRKDAVHHYQESCTASSHIQLNTARQRVKKKKRLVKMLICLMVVFQLCFIPRGVILLIYGFGPALTAHTAFPYFDMATMLLFYIKHIINPFILYCMSQDFRYGLASLFMCRTLDEFSSNAITSSKKSKHMTKL